MSNSLPNIFNFYMIRQVETFVWCVNSLRIIRKAYHKAFIGLCMLGNERVNIMMIQKIKKLLKLLGFAIAVWVLAVFYAFARLGE
ncbi:hypothetical protein CW707_01955 [Candidatus Bathyarchaeota archaeon]|nr:MAG: hypothetical protein CW707_01955 [Candidatus Bathyarchaeota archaeon]